MSTCLRRLSPKKRLQKTPVSAWRFALLPERPLEWLPDTSPLWVFKFKCTHSPVMSPSGSPRRGLTATAAAATPFPTSLASASSPNWLPALTHFPKIPPTAGHWRDATALGMRAVICLCGYWISPASCLPWLDVTPWLAVLAWKANPVAPTIQLAGLMQ